MFGLRNPAAKINNLVDRRQPWLKHLIIHEIILPRYINLRRQCTFWKLFLLGFKTNRLGSPCLTPFTVSFEKQHCLILYFFTFKTTKLQSSSSSCTRRAQYATHASLPHVSGCTVYGLYSSNHEKTHRLARQRGYCTPDHFYDCLCIFLKNYNTLVASKTCFLTVTF